MLDNQTPYEAERTWVRDKDGRHHWIVVVKATYDIGTDGTPSLSEEPVAPLYAPEYHGADGLSSLRYEADLTAMKPGTDVYLNAVAYAPQGRPSEKVTVSVQINRLRKDLLVYGDRVWERTLTGGAKPSSPDPFVTMPITYERAFGGTDQEDPNPRKHRMDYQNPVGTGVATQESQLIGTPAPSIEDPTQKPGKGRPAGFGAVASHWSPRRELAGTYDERWAAKRRPLLPVDYDPRHLLCAPADQQAPGYLKGGDRLELTNLTPSGRLAFTIPKLSFQFDTYFGSTRKEHTSELVSVIAESEGPRLILVWQTSLPCGNDADYLDRTVIRQEEQTL